MIVQDDYHWNIGEERQDNVTDEKHCELVSKLPLKG
jgi:hypothetical protein